MTPVSLRERLRTLREGARVLYLGLRGDHKGEFWSVRQWLNEREVYNDDLQGARVLEEAAKELLSDSDALLALETPEPTCDWREDEDGNWHTGCGHMFQFNEDGPVENMQKFCGYCGGALAARATAEQE